jgi:hypothetical protein
MALVPERPSEYLPETLTRILSKVINPSYLVVSTDVRKMGAIVSLFS